MSMWVQLPFSSKYWAVLTASLLVGMAWGQCGTCIGSNCLSSSQTGAWTSCNTWASGFFCGVWASFQMNTRYPIISSGHTVTISGTVPTNLQSCRSIYIRSGATLDIQTPYTGNTSGSYVLDICGTLNINLTGMANFANFDLIVHNGGVVNVTSGTLRVYRIVVESGGVINLNGGRLERQCLSSTTPGLEIQAGGTLNINSTSSQLKVHSCLGTAYTKLDGTIDCKTNCTSTSYGNFQLGKVLVSNNTSTGLIRTQTPYVPLADLTRAADNNFWGWNSTYGGTVEYYGSSSISLALSSRHEYYTLKVNCPSLSLYMTTDVVGELDLGGGRLVLNGKTLRLRGTIRYGTGSGRYIQGDAAARLEVVGKLVTTLPTSGLSTYLISSQGISGISCRNIRLRFSDGAPVVGNLGTLWLYREDAVLLETPLDIHNQLQLETGILNTSWTNLLTVRNTTPSAVSHHTTGWFSVYYSFVSGPMRRYIGSSGDYDFPVGYPNLTSYYVGWDPLQPQALHRRLQLQIQSQTGLSYIDVDFVPGVSNLCSGQLSVTEADGTLHLQLHPEGYWRVRPNTTGYTVSYDVKAYTWGFVVPPLADDRYAVLRRAEGSTSCLDWTRANGLWPPAGTLGRVIKVDGGGRDTSYAHRLGWDSFSEFAIGVTDQPLAQVAGLVLQIKQAKRNGLLIQVRGSLPGERIQLKVAAGAIEDWHWVAEDLLWVAVHQDAWVYVEGLHGRKSPIVHITLPWWDIEANRLWINAPGTIEGWGLDGRLVGIWQGPGVWDLPPRPLYLRPTQGTSASSSYFWGGMP